MTRRALLLSGGNHPFARTTPVVAGLLDDAGYELTVVGHPDDAVAPLAEEVPPDLWVCNTLRFRMLAPKYDDTRDEYAYTTTAEFRRSADHYVRNGGALLALHAAPICFDDWSGWGDIVGAAWNWERSSHPPLGPMEVRIVSDHPITAGVEDFTLTDEPYRHMDMAGDVEPLAVSASEGEDHPMLWTRSIDEGAVVTSTLGHGPESFGHPAHQRILRQAIELLTRDQVS